MRTQISNMILKLQPHEQHRFTCAFNIIETLESYGYQGYIVGGAIRNLLMGIPVNDIDITTDCLPKQMISIFERTVPVGIEHGTVIVLIEDFSFEVTTFREDGEYKDHRRPDTVNFVKSLKVDLERRDFTVNAIAADQYQLYDYFDGIKHIDGRLIQAVGNPGLRFEEDALRIIRALRFMSVLDFKIEQETLDNMKESAQYLESVSIERIIIELCKLLSGINVTASLKLFFELGINRYIPFFKSMQPYIVTQPLLLYEYISSYIFLHDKSLLQSLSALKLSNAEKRNIKETITLLHHLVEGSKTIEYLLYHFGIDFLKRTMRLAIAVNIEELHINYKCYDENALKKIYDGLQIHSRDSLAINGTILMEYYNRKGGPWIKDVLSITEHAVLHNEVKNTKNTLVEWIDRNVEI
ncbi:CCA tRNA nucleotidyltransferase [Macrococcoides canis]|uniref:CCA tRNA nucleotidyltransferase n=2 Tax=Macrococcoides canis TaxID=1855823 RepID=UPI00105C8FA1|nr:CCA tRNA nucleotidyltransferase [Macrococcus canis]TDM31799.1 CCA tRNA nucleotidyltransferase [Macrococcus canis]TDM34770.1 CCA tRNA nucleotidyltransferase [Macrococcus canis]TDM43282.1 CCA tRNA nucleotidyltransferase [Macrococcus canis]